MYSKLTLFFVIVFVNLSLECQTNDNDVQSFISSGEKKMAETEEQYYASVAGTNFDEKKLRQLMNAELDWLNQIDSRRKLLKTKLRDIQHLTAEEKAKLNSDFGLLTAAYFKVFLALHLNIHVVFDHVQLELRNVLGNLQYNDIELVKNRFNSTLTSLKAVTEDIKVHGGRFLDEIKGMLAEAKQAKNQTLIESLQYTHINDNILHVMSELSLEKANIDNQIKKGERLLKTINPRVYDVLIYLISGLKAQSNDNAQTIPKVAKRFETDL